MSSNFGLTSTPDRKNCENTHGKLEDLAYNAVSFTWCPETGAKVQSVRVMQCIVHLCMTSIFWITEYLLYFSRFHFGSTV